MLALRTDDGELRDIFETARADALSHLVAGGQRGPRDVSEQCPAGAGTVLYRDSYRAGYGHRSGYYLRDLAHQAVGAQILGLGMRTAAMIESFLRSADERRGGWPYWAVNFDHETPLAIDYRGPDDFVRELPAVFELAETVQVLHRWGADPRWAAEADAVRRIVTAFVDRHDQAPRNGVAEASGAGIFEGTASYNELPGIVLREAGDGFAAQYAATRHVAALAGGAGAPDPELEQQARLLRHHYRDVWSRHPSGDVVCGWTAEGEPVRAWSRESTWFPLLKGLLVDERAGYELDRVDRLCQAPETAPRNVEALTYLPDLYFRHARPEQAWDWMRRIHALRGQPHEVSAQGTNGSYPEVPFTLLAQIVLGLVGLEPDAPRRTLTLRPGLPSAIGEIELADVPFGDGAVTVAVTPAECRVINRTSTYLRVRLADARGFRDPHLGGAAREAGAVAPEGEIRIARH